MQNQPLSSAVFCRTYSLRPCILLATLSISNNVLVGIHGIIVFTLLKFYLATSLMRYTESKTAVGATPKIFGQLRASPRAIISSFFADALAISKSLNLNAVRRLRVLTRHRTLSHKHNRKENKFQVEICATD